MEREYISCIPNKANSTESCSLTEDFNWRNGLVMGFRDEFISLHIVTSIWGFFAFIFNLIVIFAAFKHKISRRSIADTFIRQIGYQAICDLVLCKNMY